MSARASTGFVWLLCAASGALACAAEYSPGNGGGGRGGSTSTTGAGGSSADAGASDGAATGTGGFATTGAGGGIGTGSGGSAAVDAGSDASGGLGGASGAGGSPQCGVALSSASPAYSDFVDLPVGPNVRFRVKGTITGPPPAAPLWRWAVNMDLNGQAVPFAPDPDDPSVIEFPLASAGIYVITATVRQTPLCQGVRNANASTTPRTAYWVRVTAARTRPELSKLPPHEQPIRVQSGTDLTQSFRLDPGVPVTVDPKVAGGSTNVASYVRITSPSHSWWREGDTTLIGYGTRLTDESMVRYDLLVIPLGSDGDPPRAPMLLSQMQAQLVGGPVNVDPGVEVTGSVADANGPVAGAVVILRAGVLPSTIGTSTAAGDFTLRARAGTWSASILAPEGSTLPDALVDAATGAGVDLPAPPVGPPTVRFVWRAFQPATLTARISSSAGGSVPSGLEVRLDSEDGALANVGTLTVGSQTFTAVGAVHRRAATVAGGTVTFAGLPPGSYRLSALPAMDAVDGITVTPVNLAQSQSVDVTLAAKVEVRGQLMQAPAGTRMLVLDRQPELGRLLPPVAVDGSGIYVVALDPNHPYTLVADPPPSSGLSRVPLGPFDTRAVDLDQGVRPLPAMRQISGWVDTDSGGAMVPGALVQVFCLGSGPDCIDSSQLGARNPLPLSEALTGADGHFTVRVPDR